MVVLSEQARSIANEMKDFDFEDFELWYFNVHKIKIVGTAELISYIEMKQKGIWNNGEFVINNGR